MVRHPNQTVPQDRSWRELANSRRASGAASKNVEIDSAAGERPPHKETQAYGCCVSTLTRFARPPCRGPSPEAAARRSIRPRAACTVVRAGRPPRPECDRSATASRHAALPHHQFPGHFARQRLFCAADRDRHLVRPPARWPRASPLVPISSPACDRNRKKLRRLIGHPRDVKPLARRAIGQPPSAVAATVPSALGIGSPCGSVVGWPRYASMRSTSQSLTACSMFSASSCTSSQVRLSVLTQKLLDQPMPPQHPQRERPAGRRQPHAFVRRVGGQLLSSSVLSMLVTVPGSTPERSGNLPGRHRGRRPPAAS